MVDSDPHVAREQVLTFLKTVTGGCAFKSIQDHFGAKRDVEWRRIDRALQALRKANLVTYARKTGWTAV